MPASPAVRAAHCRARALVDLAELREQQLPGFSIHFDDADTTKICLIVEPVEGHLAGLKLHFDVELPAEFPLLPVKVRNSTTLQHPNVFGNWICLDILKTEQEMEYYRRAEYTGGFTPGYSLLGIFQQVASFFGTDMVPQSFGGYVKIKAAGGEHRRRVASDGARNFRCSRCPYEPAPERPRPATDWTTTRPDWIKPDRRLPRSVTVALPPVDPPATPGVSLLQRDRRVIGLPEPATTSRRARRRRRAKGKDTALSLASAPADEASSSAAAAEFDSPTSEPSTPDDEVTVVVDEPLPPVTSITGPCYIDKLNADVLLLIFSFLPTSDLLCLTRAHSFASRLCADANVIAAREIRCFVTRKSAGETILGIGVGWNTRFKGLESSFDWLSREAYVDLDIRMGLRREPFTHWLPLAIHAGHFARARPHIVVRLKAIEQQLVLGPGKGGAGRREPSMDGYRALCSFANEIIVRLMKTADEVLAEPETRSEYTGCQCDVCTGWASERSKPASSSASGTLLHASEKALCDFISIVHLAISLAATNPMVARDARAAVTRFIRYPNARGKDVTPDLGELLVQAALCEGLGWEALRKPLVQEAMTRNVVWMLDQRQGKGLAGLALLEGESVSEWRLKTTFEASRTGLRLLMFQHMFLSELSSLGQRDPKTGRVTLMGMKNGLDARYGLPPRDMPARMVVRVKDIYSVDNFAAFAYRLGLPTPSKSWMTSYLRARVVESAQRGYHRIPVSPPALVRARVSSDSEWAEATEERKRIRNSLRPGDEVVRLSFFVGNFSSATRYRR
ncbi:hypothetical protein EXIGLDRAFT_678010 [Exidia glandulosa HHB12029]|uniref:UBC core domain-containing protein n=1 Tax=Exidia glandulosa HHB12029 TaxID=1314781 RepID=A0A165FT01_EXIGL|nr:hypothetical protein EXIGLDRAFT_678010 [Exidia glandulosa HHB12029]